MYGQVIEAYGQLLKAKKGAIDVTVTTAEALTPQQEKSLQASLKTQVRVATYELDRLTYPPSPSP